ncbi:MAG TPA: carboxypeptidase regulatory-like domain-containing protein, partial [Vicinamibacterales bacterium]|nr:carboxypeptidase regulatory-like domain-containing protein [Vicinamibacterales bacterium]
MRCWRKALVSVLALAGTLSAAAALAQVAPMTLTGVVRDATGAAVPGATVTATNQATKASRSAVSGPDGTYSITLDKGVYNVVVALANFRRATQVIEVSDTTKTADFSLQPSLSEELTVTAMKRESTVLDVPFSVAAPSEQTLRSRGVEDIEGVAANVAGFTVQNLGPGQSQVAMRGVSAGQIVRDQPGVKEQVGTFLDESVISLSLFTPDLDLFDTARVEVLRGPQGTLFGAGSLSGTVRYITNQPMLGRTQAVVELGGNTVGGGGAGGNIKAAFNTPL